MTVDPVYRPDLGREIAELKRRLDAIERSPSLGNSSIVGGAMRLLDNNGTERVRIGQLETGGEYGIVVRDGDGVIVMETTAEGTVRPYVSVPFLVNGAVSSTTAGAWTDLWELRVQQAWSNAVAINLAAAVPAGTTGEVRCQITNITGAPISNVLALSSGASLNRELAWSPAGFEPTVTSFGIFLFKIQARVTSGAGAVQVVAPTLTQRTAADSGATSGGVWTAA